MFEEITNTVGGDFFSAENVIIYVIVAVLFVVMAKVMKGIFSADFDGQDFIKGLKQRRTLLVELTLVAINIIAALVTSSLGGDEEGVNMATRIFQHFAIAFASSVVGFSVFDEIEEAFISFGNLFKGGWENIGWKIASSLKQCIFDVTFSLVFAIGGPVLNFIIMLQYTGEVDTFGIYTFNDIFNIFNFNNAFKLKPISFTEYCMTIVHFGAVLYLGSRAYDEIRKKAENAQDLTGKRIPVRDIKNFLKKRGLLTDDEIAKYFDGDDDAADDRRFDAQILFGSIMEDYEIFKEMKGSEDKVRRARARYKDASKGFVDNVQAIIPTL